MPRRVKRSHSQEVSVAKAQGAAAGRGCVLYYGSFAALERALPDTLRALKQDEPLAPVAVVVPSHLLRLHLRRSVAAALGAHANVRFYTLHELAERLAGADLANEGLSPSTPLVRELILLRTLREVRPRYFAPVADKEGFRMALLATFADLKEAGLSPPSLRRAVAGLRRARNLPADSLEKLAELVSLWEAYEAGCWAARFYEDGDLPAAAAGAARQAWRLLAIGERGSILLYGFYDLNVLQKRLVEACLRAVPTQVFFPFEDDAPAWRYARPLLDWLRERGLEVKALPEPSDDRPEVLRRLGVNLRASSGPRAQPVGEQQGAAEGAAFQIVSCPGEAREAQEILREALHPPGDLHEAGTMGILLRTPETYVDTLEKSFSAVGLEGYFHEGMPLVRTPSGRQLLLLTELVGSDYTRGAVMDFLAAGPLKEIPGVGEPPTALWNELTVEAGIVKGKDEWLERLARLRAALCGEGDETGEEDTGRRGGEECRVRAVEALEVLVRELFESLEAVESARSWGKVVEALGEALGKWVPESVERKAVLDSLDALAMLDRVGERPEARLVRRFVRRVLESQATRRGRFQCSEPLVAPLMEARGVPFDTVIVPGLVEKMFPQPVRQDPILLDAEREALNRVLERVAAGAMLDRKGRRREEEDLLFALAAGAARRRLVLTYPRLDARSARPRVPSWFLLRALEAVCGEPVDYSMLERYVREGRWGRFASMRAADPQVMPRAVSATEFDLGAVAWASQAQDMSALQYLVNTPGFFARGLRAENARWAEADFSVYDGVVRSREALERIAERFDLRRKTFSATDFETYATCPFQYLMQRVYGIEPLEEPEESVSISPLDRGSLLHGILCQFFTEEVAAGRVPVGADAWPRLEAIARQRMDAFERTGVTGYPLMWAVRREQMMEELRALLEAERAESEKQEGGCRFLPREFELQFGRRRSGQVSACSREEPVEFALGGGAVVRLAGRIDRVDVTEDGSAARILDYKTGSLAGAPKANSFDGGRALQLPLYIVAARELFGGVEIDYAAYWFIGERGQGKRVEFTTEDWEGKEESLGRILWTIVDGIHAGRFYACPDKYCERCSFSAACGHGREIDFKWERESPATAAYRAMREIP